MLLNLDLLVGKLRERKWYPSRIDLGYLRSAQSLFLLSPISATKLSVFVSKYRHKGRRAELLNVFKMATKPVCSLVSHYTILIALHKSAYWQISM